jgi:hypothetical protein
MRTKMYFQRSSGEYGLNAHAQFDNYKLTTDTP